MPNKNTKEEWMEKLYTEFQAWVDSGLWQGEDEYTKNLPIGNVANWWLEKLSLSRQELLTKLKKEVEEWKEIQNRSNSESSFGYKLAIHDFLSLLSDEQDEKTH